MDGPSPPGSPCPSPPGSCPSMVVAPLSLTEELQQWRQNQPPHALARSVQHVVPHERNPASGAQGRARQV